MLLDRRGAPVSGAGGVLGSPLSAQAQAPGRLSGDRKEQEPAENEDGAGRALRPPADRAIVNARRHQTPSSSIWQIRAKTQIWLSAGRPCSGTTAACAS